MLRHHRTLGFVSLAGGILIHLAIGAVYTAGNMVSYISSYIYHESGSSTLEEYEDIKSNVSITFAMSTLGMAMFMPVGGILERRIGACATTLIGGATYCTGVFLASELLYSASAVVAIYGFLSGLGMGILYPVPIAVSMRWFPENKGLVSGLTMAGFGGGAVLFTQVQLIVINPDNLDPCDSQDGSGGVYPTAVTENIPACIIMLGICYAAMIVAGSLMLRNPPNRGAHEQPLLVSGEGNEVKIAPGSGVDSEVQSTPPPPPPPATTTGVKGSGEAAGVLINNDTSVMEMLSTDTFWLLFSTFCLNGICNVFVGTEWKLMGEEKHVGDDAFRTTVGSVSSIFNALGRICFGMLVDRFGFTKTNLSLCVGWTAVLSTSSLVGTRNPACYFVWICLNFFFLGGNFALYAPITSELFGEKNLGRNYGLLFFSQIPGTVIAAFLLGILVENLPRDSRWDMLTIGFALFPAIAIFLTLEFARRRGARSTELKASPKPVESVCDKSFFSNSSDSSGPYDGSNDSDGSDYNSGGGSKDYPFCAIRIRP